MSGPGFLFLIGLPILLVAILVAVVVGTIARHRRVLVDGERFPGLARLHRAGLIARLVGLALGAVAAVLVGDLGFAHWGMFLAPSLTATVLLAVVLGGQWRYYGAARSAGSASLEVRDPRDYLGGRALRLAGTVLAGLAATCLVTGLLAHADDTGLSREFSVACEVSQWSADTGWVVDTVTYSTSPFPGWYYLSAVGLGIGLLVIVGAFALWLNARRPRNGSDPALVATDDALRRQTAEGVLAAVTAGAAVTLAGVAFLAARAVGSNACRTELGLGSWALALMALAALVVAIRSTVIAIVPGAGLDQR